MFRTKRPSFTKNGYFQQSQLLRSYSAISVRRKVSICFPEIFIFLSEDIHRNLDILYIQFQLYNVKNKLNGDWKNLRFYKKIYNIIDKYTFQTYLRDWKKKSLIISRDLVILLSSSVFWNEFSSCSCWVSEILHIECEWWSNFGFISFRNTPNQMLSANFCRHLLLTALFLDSNQIYAVTQSRKQWFIVTGRLRNSFRS